MKNLKPMMKLLGTLVLCLLSLTSLAKTYVQVGFYNKIPHKDVYKQTENHHLDTLILNTVMIINESGKDLARGTGFYIGKHGEQHVFVTNAHVMGANECDGSKITFLDENLGKHTTSCHSILFSKFKEEQLDITVFTVAESELNLMGGKGLKIDFDYSPQTGDKLAQAGFGIKGRITRPRHSGQNPLKRYKMNLNFDDDCVVASVSDTLFLISNIVFYPYHIYFSKRATILG